MGHQASSAVDRSLDFLATHTSNASYKTKHGCKLYKVLEARAFPHKRFVCNGLEVVRLGETGIAAESEIVGRY